MVLVDTSDREARPKEPSFGDWEKRFDLKIDLLRTAMKTKYGLELSDLEAYKFAAFSQETCMARIVWSTGEDQQLQYILTSASFDATERFLASRKGEFRPPTGPSWESPEAFEKDLRGEVAPLVQPAKGAWTLEGGYL